ncbi:MAG TPA: gamma-glutamyltransferase [Gemmatimonadales bacterium]|nr:gamma-glutamyltransferase [Gemmatimonadales bacterium]
MTRLPDSLRRPGRLIIFTVATAIIPGPLHAQSGRTPAPARWGMVTSSHYLASAVGTDILRKGGNAVDAAVATAFALAVTLPFAGNIGGGGFLVYHGADGQTTSFNFRETAPLAATERMYLDENGAVRSNPNHEGILSVGVPGTVAGLVLAHQRLGRRPWKELVQPAVGLAERGIPLSWAETNFQRWVAEHRTEYPTTAAVFLKHGTTPYEPGETWKQPQLAAILKRIRDQGRQGFYAGETARLLAAHMRKYGGIITEEDLARYQAVEQEPIRGSYRGYEVVSMPPPSSGGVALVQMLNILEGFHLREMGHNSALYLHLLTEAMRRAFADRARHLGDPAFNPDMPIARLMSKDYARELREGIELFRASPSDPSAIASVGETEHTTHLSVVDSAGNAVALTYTLEGGYGSRIAVEGAGFLLNNEMGDFNAIPGRTDSTGLIGTGPNLIAPGKRMLSSMTPTIVSREGRPVLVIGSPGGRTIINTVLQVILNVVDHGMNVAEAVEAGRIHHQWLPDVTRYERHTISPDTRRLLELMGHRLEAIGTQGQAMGIFIDRERGLLYGVADSRAFDGRVVGY